MTITTSSKETPNQLQQHQPRLTVSDISTDPDPNYDVPLWGVSFSLQPGELLLVRLERGHLRTPLADLVLGLIEPRQGQVCINDKNWQQISAAHAASLRGRCRRYFAEQNWYTALSISANICLAQQHHSLQSPEEIEAAAASLALFFGLPGLPLGSPAKTRAGDLDRAALVRAFLGRPELIILERPTQNLYPEIMPPLLNALRSVRKKGAAVIWTTGDAEIWNEPAINASQRGTMFGSRMQLSHS
jgi:phospholipid/cholesterol/gamma-HCH transport system ATP-binding protein